MCYLPQGNAVRMAFGRIKKLAGLEHIRIHDLRHESISRLWEMGLTQPEIMSISGHQDLETLERYSHASTNNLVAKLGGDMRQGSIFDPATPSNAIMDFTLREAERMWDGAEHRKTQYCSSRIIR